jgi:hypothetical protein
MYPTGISKYYDLYSWNGFNVYIIDRIWYILYSLIPLPVLWPVLIAFFTTDNSDWWKILVPSWLRRFFGLTLENGWLMG